MGERQLKFRFKLNAQLHKISIAYHQEHKPCIAQTPQTKTSVHRSTDKYLRYIREAQNESNA